ncbi:hypothetical protein Lser_V15G32443 [Lactuca serriola]
MKAITNLLANINAPVLEKSLVTYMLNGLSPKFENISMLIRHKDPPPTFLEAQSTLVSKEFCVNRHHSSTPAHSDHASAPQVLLANNNNNNRPDPRNQQNRSSSNRRTGDHSNNIRSQSYSSQLAVGVRYAPAHPWSPYYDPWVAYGWPAPPPWSVPRPPQNFQ